MRLRTDLVDYSQRIHARGWVANHDGNLSVRVRAGQFLCTPTATSKAQVRDDLLLSVDEAGQRLSGRGKPFSELSLHLAVYRVRPEVSAVIHAHCPYATALGAAGYALSQPFLPEAVVSLGPVVPLMPLAAPGQAAVDALLPLLPFYDSVLMAGNGLLAFGDSLEQAYLRVELTEHLSRIFLLALPVGGVKTLPETMLLPLLQARKKAGLGPEARGLVMPETFSLPHNHEALTLLIREELAKFRT